ncbi:MAG: hypothetical protein HQ582_09280 [Planctomycetes bacterium]|nr:hypothetical protein [Planctomycetota bacterium]
MIRSFSRWMREVLPPGWAIAIALLFYLFAEAWYLWWRWWVGIPEACEPILRLRDGYVGLTCALYGVFRVCAFHPAFRPRYRQWLSLTPWTSEKPLPLGPIHLVAQDLVVLLVALLLLHDSPIGLVLVPSAFLGAYLIAACLALLLTDIWKTAYALAFGIGLAARLANQPVVSICALAALYPLAYFGLRRSLAHFPWQMPKWLEDYWTSRGSKQQGTGKSTLGWPYDHLRFDLSDRLIPRKHAILASLLAGWLVYATVSATPAQAEARIVIPSMLSAYVAFACILLRIGIYCAVHWPPIGFWGRIRTFRWIIPGYDQVLVAPLSSLGVGAATIAVCMLGLPPEVAIPIALSCVLLITLNMGPSVKRWRLTGNHRIAPGIRSEMFQRL